jgi:hypothetical protein
MDMRTQFKDQPRVFSVKGHKIKDFGKIFLKAGEMISFVTPKGEECDFAAKEWGFYLGPSLNDRLKNEGFKTALVLNEKGQLYVLAVSKTKMNVFKKYLRANQNIMVLSWLDEWFAKAKH